MVHALPISDAAAGLSVSQALAMITADLARGKWVVS